LANMIKDLVGYEGKLVFDTCKPDGAPYKTVDGSRGQKHFGWRPMKSFGEGVSETIKWYLKYGVKHD